MGMWAQRRQLTGSSMSFFLSMGLLTVFFVAGMLFGQVYAERNSTAITLELQQYLIDYCGLDSAEDRNGWVFLSALIIYFRYPMLAVILGALIPGFLLFPAVASVFGFFLSYAVCCFARAFGIAGVLMGAVMFGPRCLVTLPCFFVLAVPAFREALCYIQDCLFFHGKRLPKQRAWKGAWFSLSMIAAVLLLAALAETLFMPVILKRLFSLLL